MDFRVLGPLEVVGRDGSVPLGGRKQRAVLGVLLARPRQLVPAAELIELIWGDTPPPAARASLQSYVSNLRRVLGEAGRIEGRSPGYVVHAENDEIDAARFEACVRQARGALGSDAARAQQVLSDALGWWRGDPYADLADEPALQPEITRLVQLRLEALELQADAELALGHAGDAIRRLERLTEQHPTRERLHELLILALYRANRQADALAAYQRLRTVLAAELGIDPSPAVQRLHRQILVHDPVLDPASRQLRGYRLAEQIGAGSFGTVYRAVQPHLDREVAIKVVHPRVANDPDFVRRFEAEAQVVARLEHPHIVPLYDYWREPDAAYLVMRLLRGGSLRDRLLAGPLELERVVALLDQVAGALDAAHASGVVHRDVKSANILLDEHGNAYLSDFGIARELPAVRSSDPGSSPYLAPEQLRGEPATPATDQYGVAVVVHEALTGRRPLLTAAGRGHAVPLPPLATRVAGVVPTVDEVLRRATATDPRDRYRDIATLARAFRRALGGAFLPRDVPSAAVRNPYKGLRAFDESDAADFFGREDAVAGLLQRLRDDPPARWLTVLGPSGAGKSSLVHAGLLPALRTGAIAGSDGWYIVSLTPGAYPLEELEAALLRVAVNPPASLIEQLRADARGLLRASKRVLPDGRAELLVVVDQLEELFTLTPDASERDHFLNLLATAVSDPGSRVRVVATLRADHYDRPLSHPRVARLVTAGAWTVLPLEPAAIERAIVEPARRVGVELEPGLAARMVADVAERPGALPLLQYALTELFEQRDGARLTVRAYELSGGVGGALAARADAICDGLDAASLAVARQVFLRLVHVGAEGVELRRRVHRSELGAIEGSGAGIEDVVAEFARHRLLTVDRAPATREPTVEVAHEALLREWGRLRGWVTASREDLRVQGRIAHAAEQWSAGGRDPGYLLRGAPLSQAEDWLARTDLAMTETEREFVTASLAQRRAEEHVAAAQQALQRRLQQRALRRLWLAAAVLAGGVVASAALAVFAFDQRGQARLEAARAEIEARTAAARELAAAALASLHSDPDLAILLALEAVQAAGADAESKEAVEALHRAVQSSRVLFTVPGLFGVDYSPDGALFATTAEDGAATLWDAATGEEVRRLCCHDARTMNLAFSPDGRRLATTSEDTTARVWDVASGEVVARFEGHSAGLLSPAFSPDGSLLATASFDGTIRLWDAATATVLRTLPQAGGFAFAPDGARLAVAGETVTVYDAGSGEPVLTMDDVPNARDVVFSPDGRHLAIADGDGYGRIRDAVTGEETRALFGHTSVVGNIAYRRDGTQLVTSSADGTVRVWDATSGAPLRVLSGLGGNIEGVAFSPDGSRVAAGSGSGLAMVWDVTAGGSRELLTVDGHDHIVFGLALSPDGSRIYTASVDGSARIWDAATGADIGLLGEPTGAVMDVAVSPDGDTVARSGGDPSAMSFAVTLFDAAGNPRGDLADVDAPPGALTFSPDGTRLAVAGYDGSAGLWDAATGRRLLVLDASAQIVFAVAFSPDGRRLVTGHQDERLKVWDVADGALLATLSRHQDNVNAAVFSADGERVYSAGEDGALKVWDAATGKLGDSITAHAAGLLDVALAPDGALLATASRDGTVKLWDVEDHHEVLTLAGHDAGVSAVAFTPDGRRLVAAGEDGSVRVFTLSTDELVDLARRRTSRALTDDECRRHLHLDRCPAAGARATG